MKTVPQTRLAFLLFVLSLLVAAASAHAQTFTLIADNRTPVPGATGNFAGFYDNRAIQQGRVVFIGYGGSNGVGIYSFENGELELIADTQTTVPGTTSLFSGFNDVAIDGSVIAFTGDWPGNQGVFVRTGHGPIEAWASSLT